MVVRLSGEENMGSTSPFLEDEHTDISQMTTDKIIQMTRSPRKPPEYKPRSRSPTRLPGGLRVPVLKNSTPSRLRPRLEESLAGLEELRVLREKQQKMIWDVRPTPTSDHALEFKHLQDRGSHRHSYGNLSSISEEDTPVKGKPTEVEPYTGNGNGFQGDNEPSLKRNSFASNNSLDSIESDISLGERDGDKSSIDEYVGRKLSPFGSDHFHEGINLQMTYPSPRHLAQRRASVQCMPQSATSESNLPNSKSRFTKRRASFQSEAVLTKHKDNNTMSKVISEMKLNCNFPGPLHAVMRQYGSSSKLPTHSSTPRSDSPSFLSSHAENKNPMDVLRDWQSEKENVAETSRTKINSHTQPRVENTVNNSADVSGENMANVKSYSLTNTGCKVEEGDNIADTKPPMTDIISNEMTKGVTVSPETRKQSVAVSDLLDTSTNLDHVREQSFTSDYFGSIETIHSVQSLPVSGSFKYKKPSNSESSSIQNFDFPPNTPVRRHSLPCNQSVRLMSNASISKSHVSYLRHGMEPKYLGNRPRSVSHSNSPLREPKRAVDPKHSHSSGNLSCGEDEVFDQRVNQTSSENINNISKALGSTHDVVPHQMKDTKHSPRTMPDHKIKVIRPEDRQSSVDLSTTTHIPTKSQTVSQDEGYDDAKEGSCDDEPSVELPEVSNLPTTNNDIGVKYIDRQKNKVTKKTLLETAL